MTICVHDIQCISVLFVLKHCPMRRCFYFIYACCHCCVNVWCDLIINPSLYSLHSWTMHCEMFPCASTAVSSRINFPQRCDRMTMDWLCTDFISSEKWTCCLILPAFCVLLLLCIILHEFCFLLYLDHYWEPLWRLYVRWDIALIRHTLASYLIKHFIPRPILCVLMCMCACVYEIPCGNVRTNRPFANQYDLECSRFHCNFSMCGKPSKTASSNPRTWPSLVSMCCSATSPTELLSKALHSINFCKPSSHISPSLLQIPEDKCCFQELWLLVIKEIFWCKVRTLPWS